MVRSLPIAESLGQLSGSLARERIAEPGDYPHRSALAESGYSGLAARPTGQGAMVLGR